MRKFTSCPIPKKFSNTLCPLTQEDINASDVGTYVVLHCTPDTPIAVDKIELENYVAVIQREFKTPCCPMCRDAIHFKSDLKDALIPSEPYHPDDLTSYAGIKKILANKDYMFAALNLHQVTPSERRKACIAIATYQVNHGCLNAVYNTAGETLVHVAAREGFFDLIKALVETYNLDYQKTLTNGNSVVDVARRYSQTIPLNFFDNLKPLH